MGVNVVDVVGLGVWDGEGEMVAVGCAGASFEVSTEARCPALVHAHNPSGIANSAIHVRSKSSFPFRRGFLMFISGANCTLPARKCQAWNDSGKFSITGYDRHGRKTAILAIVGIL